MSGWSRSQKPIADMTLANVALLPNSNVKANANVLFPNIYGVDGDEIKAAKAIPHIGWAVRRQVGSRVIWETLVAMKQPPVETADDSVLPDALISITSQPSNASIAANAATTFRLTAISDPVKVLAYQWAVSTDNVAWTNLTNGGVYSNVTTNVLTISNTTGLNSRYYRANVSNAAANASIVSNSAQIIFV